MELGKVKTKPEDLYETMKKKVEENQDIREQRMPSREEMKEWAEDMAVVLTEKTEGEAADMVRGLVKKGEGLEAYRKMHRWYQDTTAYAKTERISRAMKPKKIEKEDNAAAAGVEDWEPEMASLKAEWPDDFTMTDTMQKTAIMFMLPAKARENVESLDGCSVSLK